MSKNFYTPEELRLVETAYKAGRSYEEIAKALGRTEPAIRNLAYRMRLDPKFEGYGLGGPKNHHFTPEMDEQLLQLREKGYKDKQIACIMGLPYETITSRIHYLREKIGPEAVPFKYRSYNSREIKTMLEMWQAGAGRYEIAKALRREPGTVTCYISYLRRLYGEETVPRRRGGKK